MGFLNRSKPAPDTSGLLAACAADYAANRRKRERDSRRDDANVRAAASEAAAARTEQPKRGWAA